ncbi:hypothetical protein B0T10DRAFT_554765 [Thelonectria olida]|uniref:Xylanolytic transcriptional activator regulatory domain-containing protein n=1 Tax=Thelonectria olida TaxID=1576542 RepID=A0A9P9AXH4_9HYPO|nr:hypothetical protein B0T10DRAFT_554765 [Thelonectria olida]
MNRELQELRSRQESDHVLSNSEPSTVNTSHSSQPASEELVHDDFDFYEDTVALDGVLVDSHLAIGAFQIFAEVFRPQLPLLEIINVRDIHVSQSFLFWTILVIVSSHLPGAPHQDVYTRLHEPYTKLLKEEALGVPLPLHKIQALIFLCAWPLPIEAQVKDPSWLYCGIAIQAARYMGLDREQPLPTTRSMGVTPGTRRARINTWLGCFYVGTSLSLHLGLQPPIDSDLDFAIIHTFLNEKTISFDFAAQVRIHLVIAKFTNILLQNTSDVVGSSLVRLVNGELDAIKSAFHDDDAGSLKLEFSILVTKLHFHALMITKSPLTSPSRELMLQAGLTAAMRIIYISSRPTRSTFSSLGDGDLLSVQRQRALPKTYYRGVAFATVFLITFFHLNASASQEERQSAASHISMAQSVFNTCSIDSLDEYARAARMFEILTRLPPGSADPNKLRLTHRMGVSILFNATRIADEARGRRTDSVENLEGKGGVPQSASQAQEAQLDMLYPMQQMGPAEFEMLRQLGWVDPLTNPFNVDSIYGPQY